MGVSTRADFAQAVLKDFYSYFFERYDAYNPVYQELFELKKSDGAIDLETTAIGMGRLQEKPEGAPVKFRDPMEGNTIAIRNITFSDGFKISKELYDDSRKLGDLIQKVAATWAEAVVATEEEYASKIFNKGALTAGHSIFDATINGVYTDPYPGFIYDGKPFFAASGNEHTTKSGGSFYNWLDLALSGDNLKTVLTLMTDTNAYNERGERIVIAPDVLVVPPSMEYDARTILESTLLPGSPNNDKNVLQGLLRLVVWRYLEDSDAWFVGCSGRGLRFLDRQEPIIEIEYNHREMIYEVTITRRFGVGVTNWRYWAASKLAQA